MPAAAKANHILGYPLDARLLIVNADDFGACFAQNLGTIRSIDEGLVRSCSLMSPAPWSLHAAHFLKENPRISCGVHLTLVSEYPPYRWGPLTPAQAVSSLVDESGYFRLDDGIPDLLLYGELAEIEREFRAQIEWTFAQEVNVTHLDGHYHVHEEREDIFDLTVSLALEYGLALRVGKRTHIDALQALGYPTNDHDVMDSGRTRPEDKPEVFTRLLRELPSGLSEWAFHPGIVSDELRAVMHEPVIPGVSATPEGRQSDFDFITSDEVGAIVKQEGIQVLDYAVLQPFWQRI